MCIRDSICTKSGKTFPTNATDWQLFCSSVPAGLQKLHKRGMRIAIFTNQKGISTGKTSLSDIQTKIDALQQTLGVPLLACILTKDDSYRKPLPTAWKLVEAELNVQHHSRSVSVAPGWNQNRVQ
eukprot:TRINITY_DN39509_c0_g1_i1.p1 TRINITY_DN39509_c0_g1~~TRINITY_DN39509_c0_g1_i1.p1  ORF type:complete len:125 (+),score=39.27 TRINITY_DN39509_c0_g1_i1:136-510(+)